jgi:prepilin-type N-terminal cleavage/methylation domain-containing protein
VLRKLRPLRVRSRDGLTLVELLITLTIMAVLAATVLPMAEVTVQRAKELELRRSLRLFYGHRCLQGGLRPGGQGE